MNGTERVLILPENAPHQLRSWVGRQGAVSLCGHRTAAALRDVSDSSVVLQLPQTAKVPDTMGLVRFTAHSEVVTLDIRGWGNRAGALLTVSRVSGMCFEFRRRHYRSEVEGVKAELHSRGGRRLSQVLDLSLGGVGLSLPAPRAPLPTGQRVLLHFLQAGRAQASGAGRVRRYCGPDAAGDAVLGVEFEDVDARLRRWILDVLWQVRVGGSESR